MVSQFLVEEELICALTKGKVKCAGRSGERNIFKPLDSAKEKIRTLEQLSNVQFLFHFGRNAMCAQMIEDAYCWNTNDSYSVYRLSKFVRIPKNSPPKEIRFLNLLFSRWALNKREPGYLNANLLQYSYVSGSTLYKSAVILKEKKKGAFFGDRVEYGNKLAKESHITLDLAAVPTAQVPSTPCYVFGWKVRCFDVPEYARDSNKEEGWVSSTFRSKHADLVNWLEGLDGVSQIDSTPKQSNIDEGYTVCAINSEGLKCVTEEKDHSLKEIKLPEELVKNAGTSSRVSFQNLSGSLRNLSEVLYLERAQVLTRQSDIFNAELANGRDAKLFTLFAAALVRPFLENVNSAFIEQHVLPHFRSTLDQALSSSGISALADFGFDPVLTRTAIRTLVVDLQILKQHVTAPADRLLIEQAISSLGNALASKSLRASIGIHSLQNLLEILSTSPRSRCYALQALVATEYLLKGGNLS